MAFRRCGDEALAPCRPPVREPIAAIVDRRAHWRLARFVAILGIKGRTMRVEILCTGDEILTGKTINTNYSHIARRLGDFGLDVHWGTTVGDDRATLLAAFRQAGERADAVIVNGGLRPTVDDLSQEIAAQAAGVDLVLNEEWLARMEADFHRRRRIMPPHNRKQAMLPATAEVSD